MDRGRLRTCERPSGGEASGGHELGSTGGIEKKAGLDDNPAGLWPVCKSSSRPKCATRRQHPNKRGPNARA